MDRRWEEKFYPKVAPAKELKREEPVGINPQRPRAACLLLHPQLLLLPSGQELCQGGSSAQRKGRAWTVIISGETETFPAVWLGNISHGLREKRIHGNRQVRVTTCVQYFRLSKQSGRLKASHKWVPRNLLLAALLTQECVPMTCPSLGWRFSLIYLEQKQQDSTSHLGRQPGQRQRINRSLLLIPILLPMGSAVNQGLS